MKCLFISLERSTSTTEAFSWRSPEKGKKIRQHLISKKSIIHPFGTMELKKKKTKTLNIDLVRIAWNEVTTTADTRTFNSLRIPINSCRTWARLQNENINQLVPSTQFTPPSIYGRVHLKRDVPPLKNELSILTPRNGDGYCSPMFPQGSNWYAIWFRCPSQTICLFVKWN